MDANFDPTKSFAEAHERHEHAMQPAHHAEANRWVPISAAILAVFAALVTLLTNQHASQALDAKSDAIIAVSRAADIYNEYEADSIKQHGYEALIAAGVTVDPKRLATLQAVADEQKAKKKPLLVKARAFEEQAKVDEERSNHLLHVREHLEIAVTLLEVAIVLVSISAVAKAPFLPIVAALAAAGGVVMTIVGLR